ncbi:MAG: class II aldolase/adducin family protein [Aquabacterium sp.]
MADDLALRTGLVEQARALNSTGLSAGTSGNVSARCDGGFLITPSGAAYDRLAPQDLVHMTPDGQFDLRQRPSSEWRMHRDLYASRADVQAVVHAHPPHCTALAIHGREIPAVHYMVALSGGPTVRCAGYATFGTQALSDAMLAAMQGRHCCLLAHHGMIATGENLARAMWRAVELEALAQQYLLALSLGPPPVLDEAEIARVVQRFSGYGAGALAAPPAPAT